MISFDTVCTRADLGVHGHEPDPFYNHILTNAHVYALKTLILASYEGSERPTRTLRNALGECAMSKLPQDFTLEDSTGVPGRKPDQNSQTTCRGEQGCTPRSARKQGVTCRPRSLTVVSLILQLCLLPCCLELPPASYTGILSGVG